LFFITEKKGPAIILFLIMIFIKVQSKANIPDIPARKLSYKAEQL